jgi:hypothetical protein
MLGTTFNSYLTFVSFSRCARQISLGMLLAPLAFGPINLARAQTVYSPTTVVCSYNALDGSNVTNPTGPETQSGGIADFISNPKPPPAHFVWPLCNWAGFGSGTLPAEASLSVPFVFGYSGAGQATVSWSTHQIDTDPNCQNVNTCPWQGTVNFTGPYQGTVSFTLPAGTDLSTLDVFVAVNGAVHYNTSGEVGWIHVQ